MASRRMFSKNIIDADRFIDMSAEARVLYFHLGMDADDDGFVGNPKSIMRTAGCRPENMAELETQGYVAMFPSGVCAILHWREHNLLRRDRYVPTIHREEYAALYPEEEQTVDNTATTMATSTATQEKERKEKEREEKKGQVSPGEEKKIKFSAYEDREGEYEGERARFLPGGQIVENFPLTPEEQRRRLQYLTEEKRAEWQRARGITCMTGQNAV